MSTIAVFSPASGAVTAALVYHLAWMFSELGVPTLAVDLDPKANLTAMFLDEDRLEALWPDGEHPQTLLGAIQPILSGIGDVLPQPHAERLGDMLHLSPGDLGLSRFEDKLSDAWPRCQLRDEAAFRVMTAFHRIIENTAGTVGAEVALIDVGPNLGAINRAALIASEHVVVPLAPDLFSLQGLRNLGPALREWRGVWSDLRGSAPSSLSMPTGAMGTIGYVIMQHGLRDNRPVRAYGKWMDRIPGVYESAVLDITPDVGAHGTNSHELALLKHYRSLIPMAMEARKPVFSLKPADGAIGAHGEAVRSARHDFVRLAQTIAGRTGLTLAPD